MNALTMGFRMTHAIDPKDKILQEIGDISGLNLFHNQVLVSIYQRPEKTAGGIILTPKTQKEDQFQGIVGLVLAVGPAAFVDDSINKFHGKTVKPGDWIVYRASDTHKISVNGTLCRLLEDSHIKGTVSHPDLVF